MDNVESFVRVTRQPFDRLIFCRKEIEYRKVGHKQEASSISECEALGHRQGNTKQQIEDIEAEKEKY